jgi:archaetidylinositol phosphate synthase
MTLDQFRPHAARYIDPFVRLAIRCHITPSMLTVASLIVAAGAGMAFYLRQELWGVILVALNAIFDAVDGSLARATNTASAKGDFLDHVIDRYSDIFIITGIFAGGYVSWIIGVFALTGVLMASYLGTQSQAVGVGRNYGGVLGRADRLVLIMVAGAADILMPGTPAGLPFIAWLLILFGILGHFTAIQRFRYTWQRLP